MLNPLKIPKIQIWNEDGITLQMVNSLISVKDRAAIVTGAASGIGKDTALRLKETGMQCHGHVLYRSVTLRQSKQVNV